MKLSRVLHLELLRRSFRALLVRHREVVCWVSLEIDAKPLLRPDRDLRRFKREREKQRNRQERRNKTGIFSVTRSISPRATIAHKRSTTCIMVRRDVCKQRGRETLATHYRYIYMLGSYMLGSTPPETALPQLQEKTKTRFGVITRRWRRISGSRPPPHQRTDTASQPARGKPRPKRGASKHTWGLEPTTTCHKYHSPRLPRQTAHSRVC